ncbi:MAG TPA: PAS domain S-box protein, partial [Kofleriaceae bacterium]|nr:PAS domain S-box protein [Kofleriaceae bacterium]
LVPPEQRAPVEEVINSVLGGTNLEAFDLDLSTTSGEPICVSVTTSTVLAKSGAVILSFRDVTAERALEGELQQTKDFLERLIDSAVDAIVAADMQGHIILFNPGAERIFGQRAEEVIGHLLVGDLYPTGTAQQVMQMLRSPEHGGVGRLEQTRLEVRSQTGELVPVNMTASILYENGHEAATVGIINDLRDRLRMEERLRDVQEQLEMQERQAMVAQLAGAAAHELNQPLTSILGYGQLIERQSERDAPHLRAVQIIQREAARMADIVRNIGRITRYETKQYVGSASIMDLDASAGSSPDIQLSKHLDEHLDEHALDAIDAGEESGEVPELGEVTQVADVLQVSDGDPTPSLEEIVLADMTSGLGGSSEPLGLDALIEPVEEEITAQHLIVSRRPGLRLATRESEPPPIPAPIEAGGGGGDRGRDLDLDADADADAAATVDAAAPARPEHEREHDAAPGEREDAAPHPVDDDDSVDLVVDEGEVIDGRGAGPRSATDDGERVPGREGTGEFQLEETSGLGGEDAAGLVRSADEVLRKQSNDPTG